MATTDQTTGPFRVLDYLRAVRASTLRHPPRTALVWLALRADGAGIAWPSLDTWAVDADLSRATISRSVVALRGAGWVRTSRRTRTASTTYTLLVPSAQAETSQAATSPDATSLPETTECSGGNARVLSVSTASAQPETLSAHVSAHGSPQGSGESDAAASAAPVMPPSKPSRRRPETQVPPKTAPVDEIDAWCAQWGIPSPTTDTEAAKMLDHARTNERVARNWGAAWDNWQRRSAEYARPNRLPGQQPVDLSAPWLRPEGT